MIPSSRVSTSAVPWRRVLLVLLLALAGCTDAPESGELAGPGEAPVAPDHAVRASGATAVHAGVSRAPTGWRVLGEFEGDFDALTGRAELVMIEPGDRKSASVPGMYQGLRGNEDSEAVAGRVRFLQVASGNGTDEAACETFWSTVWGGGDTSSPFWVPEPMRPGFLTDLHNAASANRFCTNFRLINDVGRPLREVWIIVDGITTAGVRAWVQSVPRSIPAQQDGEPDVLLDPNSQQGMFRYGDFAEDQEVLGQWYFHLFDNPLGDFRVRGRIVEILREQCRTGTDDNGDGLEDSGCYQFHAGADCSLNQDCVSGACNGGVPIDPHAGSGSLGECAPSDSGGACLLDSDCTVSLVCNGAGPGPFDPGTCGVPTGGDPIGTPCTENDDCASGFCDPWLGECRIEAGGTCSNDPDCAYVHECGAGDTCELLPAFVTTWNTTFTSPGSTPAGSVQLPLVASGNYDFLVDWGDGTVRRITEHDQAEVVHDFGAIATETVTIRGQIEGWRFANTGDRRKLIDIAAWGPLRFGNAGSYFHGATNLTITATDIPDLSGTTNMAQAFFGNEALTTIANLNDWDVSGVTAMNAMFEHASNFNGDVSGWETGNVTTFARMFATASSFSGDLSAWDTSSAGNMSFMFFNASNFNADIGSWETGNVTNMSRMFDGASSFNQDLSSWETGEVSNMSFMFANATSFNGDISTWDTSSVSNMSFMFSDAGSFNQDLSGWNTSNVNNMGRMFFRANAFNGDVSTWNVSSVTDMNFMFFQNFDFNQDISGWDVSGVNNMDIMMASATSFDQDLSGWCVSQFTEAPLNFDLNTPAWSLSKPLWGFCPQPLGSTCAVDQECLSGFCDPWLDECRVPTGGPCVTAGDCPYVHTCGVGEVCTLTDGFVSVWDPTEVSGGSSDADQIRLPLTSAGTYDFLVDWGDGNQSRITQWDHPDVTHTYAGTGPFTITIRGEIEGWRFANDGDRLKLLLISAFGPLRLGNEGSYFHGAEHLEITATDPLDLTGTSWMTRAFQGCTSLTSAPSMASWETGHISMFDFMFHDAPNFNEDISGWDTSSAFTMRSMFSGAQSFVADIGGWETGNVLFMDSMFSQHPNFNADISGWDTGKVREFALMFHQASSFNRPIGGWDVSSAENMQQMFDGAALFNQNINGWEMGNVENTWAMFRDAVSFNQPLDGWNMGNVTVMFSMFEGATSFNQPVGLWDTSNVTGMGSMFRGATGFSQSLAGWNTSQVTGMQLMFFGATSFNGDVTTWDTSAVTNLNSTFNGASSFNQDLSGWCVTNFPTMPSNFDAGASSWSMSRPIWGTCP